MFQKIHCNVSFLVFQSNSSKRSESEICFFKKNLLQPKYVSLVLQNLKKRKELNCGRNVVSPSYLIFPLAFSHFLLYLLGCWPFMGGGFLGENYKNTKPQNAKRHTKREIIACRRQQKTNSNAKRVKNQNDYIITQRNTTETMAQLEDIAPRGGRPTK